MSGPRAHFATLLTIRALLDEIIEALRNGEVIKAEATCRSAAEEIQIHGLTEEDQIQRWGT